MSTHPEQISRETPIPFFVPERPHPIQEPLEPAPLVETFLTHKSLPDLSTVDVPAEEAQVTIEIQAVQASPAPASQSQLSATDRIPLLAQSRASRLAAQSATPSDHPLHKFMRKKLIGDLVQIGGIAQWVIEFMPGPIWGPGDALSLYMAISRQNPLTGEHIDRYDAGLCAIAACVPFVPAKALTGPGRMIRHLFEEGHHAILTHDYSGVKKELTLKNVVKFAFSII